MGTWFEEFAPLYYAGGQLGLDRAQVDAYEVWEFAAVLGRHLPPKPAAGEPAQAARPGDGFDPLSARMEAQRLGLPPPTPPPSPPPPAGITTLRPDRQRREGA